MTNCSTTQPCFYELGRRIGIALGGCNRAKSPDVVAHDVAKAEQQGEAKVDEKLKDLNNSDAKGVYGVETTAAGSDHKVALAQCNALAGSAQNNCKDKADAEYNAATARARADLAQAKQ